MDAAQRTEALTAEASARFVRRTFEEADRKRYSARAGLGLAVLVAALHRLDSPHAQVAFGVMCAVTCLSWLGTAVMLRVSGRTRVVKWLDLATEVVGAWTSAFIIFASGTVITPLWLVPFAHSFVWLPRRRAAVVTGRWAMAVAFLGLALWQAGAGHLPAAVIVLALLGGHLIMHDVSAQLVRQRLELEAEAEALHAELEGRALRKETDRIARELHDGLGAELVGLMLSLRGKGPSVEAHVQRVLNLLEELRSLVWALRGGRGTLAEFEKLVRARARMTLSGTHRVATTTSVGRATQVEPEAAMALLTAMHDVLSKTASSSSVSEVNITLEAAPELAVTVAFPQVPRHTLAQLVEAGLECPGASVSLTDAGVRIAVR